MSSSPTTESSEGNENPSQKKRESCSGIATIYRHDSTLDGYENPHPVSRESRNQSIRHFYKYDSFSEGFDNPAIFGGENNIATQNEDKLKIDASLNPYNTQDTPTTPKPEKGTVSALRAMFEERVAQIGKEMNGNVKKVTRRETKSTLSPAQNSQYEKYNAHADLTPQKNCSENLPHDKNGSTLATPLATQPVTIIEKDVSELDTASKALGMSSGKEKSIRPEIDGDVPLHQCLLELRDGRVLQLTETESGVIEVVSTADDSGAVPERVSLFGSHQVPRKTSLHEDDGITAIDERRTIDDFFDQGSPSGCLNAATSHNTGISPRTARNSTQISDKESVRLSSSIFSDQDLIKTLISDAGRLVIPDEVFRESEIKKTSTSAEKESKIKAQNQLPVSNINVACSTQSSPSSTASKGLTTLENNFPSAGECFREDLSVPEKTSNTLIATISPLSSNSTKVHTASHRDDTGSEEDTAVARIVSERYNRESVLKYLQGVKNESHASSSQSGLHRTNENHSNDEDFVGSAMRKSVEDDAVARIFVEQYGSSAAKRIVENHTSTLPAGDNVIVDESPPKEGGGSIAVEITSSNVNKNNLAEERAALIALKRSVSRKKNILNSLKGRYSDEDSDTMDEDHIKRRSRDAEAALLKLKEKLINEKVAAALKEVNKKEVAEMASQQKCDEEQNAVRALQNAVENEAQIKATLERRLSEKQGVENDSAVLYALAVAVEEQSSIARRRKDEVAAAAKKRTDEEDAAVISLMIALQEESSTSTKKKAEEKMRDDEAKMLEGEDAKRKDAEEEAKRKVAEVEANRVAAEVEAKRNAAEREETRMAAEKESNRKVAEQEAMRKSDVEVKRVAAEEDVQKVAPMRKAAEVEAKGQADRDAKRVATEQEARRVPVEENGTRIAMQDGANMEATKEVRKQVQVTEKVSPSRIEKSKSVSARDSDESAMSVKELYLQAMRSVNYSESCRGSSSSTDRKNVYETSSAHLNVDVNVESGGKTLETKFPSIDESSRVKTQAREHVPSSGSVDDLNTQESTASTEGEEAVDMEQTKASRTTQSKTKSVVTGSWDELEHITMKQKVESIGVEGVKEEHICEFNTGSELSVPITETVVVTSVENVVENGSPVCDVNTEMYTISNSLIPTPVSSSQQELISIEVKDNDDDLQALASEETSSSLISKQESSNQNSFENTCKQHKPDLPSDIASTERVSVDTIVISKSVDKDSTTESISDKEGISQTSEVTEGATSSNIESDDEFVRPLSIKFASVLSEMSLTSLSNLKKNPTSGRKSDLDSARSSTVSEISLRDSSTTSVKSHHSMFAEVLKDMSKSIASNVAASTPNSRVASLQRSDSLNFLKDTKFGNDSRLLNSIMHSRYLTDMENNCKIDSTWTSSDEDDSDSEK